MISPKECWMGTPSYARLQHHRVVAEQRIAWRQGRSVRNREGWSDSEQQTHAQPHQPRLKRQNKNTTISVKHRRSTKPPEHKMAIQGRCSERKRSSGMLKDLLTIFPTCSVSLTPTSSSSRSYTCSTTTNRQKNRRHIMSPDTLILFLTAARPQ